MSLTLIVIGVVFYLLIELLGAISYHYALGFTMQNVVGRAYVYRLALGYTMIPLYAYPFSSVYTVLSQCGNSIWKTCKQFASLSRHIGIYFPLYSLQYGGHLKCSL